MAVSTISFFEPMVARSVTRVGRPSAYDNLVLAPRTCSLTVSRRGALRALSMGMAFAPNVPCTRTSWPSFLLLNPTTGLCAKQTGSAGLKARGGAEVRCVLVVLAVGLPLVEVVVGQVELPRAPFIRAWARPRHERRSRTQGLNHNHNHKKSVCADRNNATLCSHTNNENATRPRPKGRETREVYI